MTLSFTIHSLLLGFATIVALGCAPSATNPPPTANTPSIPAAPNDALVQFSVLAALAADDYTDGAPLRDVLAAGDFGLGTFDRLDGEMILLDGKMFQALADGTVRPANLGGTTPFAAVTFFKDDGRRDELSAATLTHLEEQIDRQLPRRNSPYALRITGEFTEVTLRSVPAQSPPFRPLVEVVRDQVTWQHRSVRGTLIGLRCPAWMGTLNVSGYHWHFLSDDQKIGGHVLACQFEHATLRYDDCSSVDIRIPQSTNFDQFDIRHVTQQDVEQIERQRSTSPKD
jgi:acetolactate decarboxylase